MLVGHLKRSSRSTVLTLLFALIALLSSPVLLAGLFDSVFPSVEAEENEAGLMAGIRGALVIQKSYPDLTNYAPVGPRMASEVELESQVIPDNTRFYTIHGGVRSDDEVATVYPPVIEETWTKEPLAFLPEGPTFDTEGNVYITPLLSYPNTETDSLLISLEPETGSRRWAISPGQVGQGGAPTQLFSPELNEVVIYAGGAESIVAVSSQGEVLWETATGLNPPDDRYSFDVLIENHLFGINYHEETDTLIALYASGKILILDRVSGSLLTTYTLPGAPAKQDFVLDLPELISDGAETALRQAFLPVGVEIPADQNFRDNLIAALLGGGTQVSNYFAVDPNSGTIWVAGTDDDQADGAIDGVSEFGALYALALNRDGQSLSLSEKCKVSFAGGTASTPSVRADGKRIYVSDSFQNVLSIDEHCHVVWQVDIGDQAIGSLGVSSVGGELYASTGNSVYKILDHGPYAEIAWESDFDNAYYLDGYLINQFLSAINPLLVTEGLPEISVSTANLEVAGIGENGVMVQSGLGIRLGEEAVSFTPLVMAMSLLDKETGKVINSTMAREESVAVISTAGDGSITIGNSPIRRAFLRGLIVSIKEMTASDLFDPLLDALVPPLQGGVSHYTATKSFRLFAEDAACSAQKRISNLQQYYYVTSEAGREQDRRASQHIVQQALNNLEKALSEREISYYKYYVIDKNLSRAEEALTYAQFSKAEEYLVKACGKF